jgi:predicted N-acetyltransferase YhbS
VPALESLIPLSARELQSPHYSAAQIEAALGPVFAVDLQLIADGTYFVVEHEGAIVGCGGWSKRAAQYGAERTTSPAELNPNSDPARIRAFFVHPAWARRGIGRAIMRECETALIAAGFNRAEIVATLAGEPLYAAFGYDVTDRFLIPLPGSLSLPAVRMTKTM